jgi:hypothetical protein
MAMKGFDPDFVDLPDYIVTSPSGSGKGAASG